ncbi:type I secretion system permease/ATPase [Prosthecomicrobium sp. N25]|uniref:type I secretion system permease/ATPase n=1 Tax=Prosthecomicrobium sp. N25 TaxID=3129254 RepID=UPI0030784A8E
MGRARPLAFLRTRLVLGLGAISIAVNMLYLTGSLFMLEIYDRVIPSRSVPTLIGLCVIAGVLYAFQGLLDACRGRALVRIGTAFDATLAPKVFRAIGRASMSGQNSADGLMPLRDLETVRGFISGSGPLAFFDLPWIPVYIVICYAFHPLIGFLVVFGAVLLGGLALASELLGRGPARKAAGQASQRIVQAEAMRRNAEVALVLGMRSRLLARWEKGNRDYREAHQRAADLTMDLGSISKVVRYGLQSAVLALGAWLVIEQHVTGGIMIAASILTSRALAPVELAIANWKNFVNSRQAWERLSTVLARVPEADPPMALPAPTQGIAASALVGGPPASQRIAVADVTFALRAGQGLGIIGPSGSGKSSLVRLLVGVWTPLRGKVRIDGAALDQWDGDSLGRHIGYLPQDVELFSGTVAENIARFDPQAKPEAVVAAAKAAGVHNLVLTLPLGYQTPIGEGGAVLSAGQRQRVALARALYGDPFLVVLDEPNSNLDSEGEQALTEAILGVRARGGVCIVVAHRPRALAAVDLVMTMSEGRMVAFGPKEEVLAKVLAPAPSPVARPAAAAGAGSGIVAAGAAGPSAAAAAAADQNRSFVVHRGNK